MDESNYIEDLLSESGKLCEKKSYKEAIEYINMAIEFNEKKYFLSYDEEL